LIRRESIVAAILIEDSGVVDRLRAAWLNHLAAGSCKKLLNARYLTECPRKVVSRVLAPSSIKRTSSEIVREAMEARDKSIWLNILENNYNFRIDSRDIELVDSNLWLKTTLDAKITVDGLSIAVIFRHTSLLELEKIKTMGPLKRDVVTAASTAYMAGLQSCVIVYSHGEDAIFSHVDAGSFVMDPISQKCRELSEYILVSQLPPICKSKKCGFCE
jgi:hypothetical protein